MKPKNLNEWSKMVRQRDKACQDCGSSSMLVAHHIKPKSVYPSLRLEVDNGICLCADCHTERHRNDGLSNVRPKNGKLSMRKRIKDLEETVDQLFEISRLLARTADALKIEYDDRKDRVVSRDKELNNAKKIAASMFLKYETASMKASLLEKENDILKKRIEAMKQEQDEFFMAYDVMIHGKPD